MSEPPVPRRYAMLGKKPELVSHIGMLCDAIRTSDGHEFIRPVKGGEATDPLDWRLLAEDERIEAVIVCSQDAATLEAARQLAIRGKPLVIDAAATLPADFVTEMSLYESEGTSVLKPWFYDRPHFRILCRWLDEAALGSLQSIECERVVPPNVVEDEQRLAGLTVLDIDLLRWLGGDYSQVTCIRTGGDEHSFVSQTLQLAGTGLPDATLIYRRVASPPSATFRFVGTENSAELLDSHNHFTWQVGGEEFHRVPILPDKNGLNELYRKELDRLWTGDQAASNWRDLVRNFEIQEAMQRSLRRRRTIDLQFETTSERSQFKTYMATIGCGVVLWTMLGIIALLLAGAVLDPRDRMQRQAEAAGFVLRTDEFEAGAAMLTPAGREHLQQISTGIGLGDAVVYIEASATAGDPDPLDDQRRDEVWSQLSQAGAEDASRVVVRPLRGQWFLRGMQLARVLVFAPVALFLLFQLLLLITRPAAPQKTHSP
jgi:predicted dehydrogenase